MSTSAKERIGSERYRQISRELRHTIRPCGGRSDQSPDSITSIPPLAFANSSTTS
jgi:hypothetical protein